MDIIGKLKENELEARQKAAKTDDNHQNSFEKMRASLVRLVKLNDVFNNGFRIQVTENTKKIFHLD